MENLTLREMLEKLGATGDYPDGVLNDDDEGALNVGMTVDEEKNAAIIAFGKPVAWIGLHAKDLDALIASLRAVRARLK